MLCVCTHDGDDAIRGNSEPMQSEVMRDADVQFALKIKILLLKFTVHFRGTCTLPEYFHFLLLYNVLRGKCQFIPLNVFKTTYLIDSIYEF